MMKQSQAVLLVAAVTALQPVARLQRAPVRMTASDILASDRILIAPALATSNVAKLGEEAQAAVAAGADCLHFNVMDGYTSSAESTSASGRPGCIIYYSGSLDAARKCLASSHEAS